eukprot:3842233-Rhodomonas_salina.1
MVVLESLHVPSDRGRRKVGRDEEGHEGTDEVGRGRHDITFAAVGDSEDQEREPGAIIACARAGCHGSGDDIC